MCQQQCRSLIWLRFKAFGELRGLWIFQIRNEWFWSCDSGSRHPQKLVGCESSRSKLSLQIVAHKENQCLRFVLKMELTRSLFVHVKDNYLIETWTDRLHIWNKMTLDISRRYSIGFFANLAASASSHIWQVAYCADKWLRLLVGAIIK